MVAPVSRTHHARPPRKARPLHRGRAGIDLVELDRRAEIVAVLAGNVCFRGCGAYGLDEDIALDDGPRWVLDGPHPSGAPSRVAGRKVLVFSSRYRGGLWFVAVVDDPRDPFRVGYASEIKCDREGL